MVRWPVRVVGIGVCLALASTALTDDQPAPESADQRQQQEWIRQLGSTEFQVRESAARKLTELGLAAKAVLMDALREPDLEIRMRAHQLLVLALQRDFDQQLAAFIADVDGKHEHDLPGWREYQEIVGGSLAARKLFAEMVRNEASLLDAFASHSDELPRLFVQRVQDLQPYSSTGLYEPKKVTSANMAALLVVGKGADLGLNTAGAYQMYNLLNQTPSKQAITSGPYSELLKTLLEHWISGSTDESPTHESLKQFHLLLALKYDLEKTGLKIASETLKQTSPSPANLQFAAIAVGRFGDKQYIPQLLPHLRNETVCHTWSNRQLKPEGVIEIQIRDVVLVMLLRLTNQDPKKYGFTLLRENPETIYHIYTFGFIDDKDRQIAQEKWADWSKNLAEK